MSDLRPTNPPATGTPDRTNDLAFQARFAEILERMKHVPSDQREHLEALAAETQARHAANREAIAAARDGLRELAAAEALFHLNLELLAELAGN